MLKRIDSFSAWSGRLAAWLFFIIGIFIVYEVIARYVFLAPTVWSEEMSRFLQIWATYLAAASVLKTRQLIAIDVITRNATKKVRITCESLALLVIIVFCLVAVWYGLSIVIESIKIGRASSSMLAVPSWMTEAAIPVGFTLLLIQALAELARTVSGKTQPASPRH